MNFENHGLGLESHFPDENQQNKVKSKSDQKNNRFQFKQSLLFATKTAEKKTMLAC